MKQAIIELDAHLDALIQDLRGRGVSDVLYELPSGRVTEADYSGAMSPLLRGLVERVAAAHRRVAEVRLVACLN